jgi:hypothetical protein
MINFVKVQFLEGYSGDKKYCYKNNIAGLKVGDLVVVEARDSYGLCKVSDVDVSGTNATKYVVSVFDPSWLEVQKERDAKIKGLKEKLEARKKVFEEEKFWQTFAMQDKEAASILNEIKSLQE